MRLIPHNGFSRPSSGLTVASPGSAPALRLRSRPQMASGRWAALGPAWASRWPLQAQVVLKSASPGPAPASWRPPQEQRVLIEGPSGSRSCLLSASRSPASASRMVASPGPALPPGCVSRPSSCFPAINLLWFSSCPAPIGLSPASRRPLPVQNFLESASPGPAPIASQWPLSAQPSSCLSAAFPAPAFDFWQPLLAQNLTSSQPLQAQPPAFRGPSQARPLPPSGLSKSS
ncbi:LOW QUALITY PROTEIN: putative uncharacterized protein FLJ46235 [Nomascus leucogenys]|uniref:LOW QUALITY PROTEIN: putative uncharacterized protein FLJ46235 n=1 Tax=Nomascus leucogenys TaxID=61853 RepID=UPI00122DA1D0|nr:LOW QUALITY PROTEIN: putative uncharacterized protein FLJ46235 [Nomascus leucogenys]